MPGLWSGCLADSVQLFPGWLTMLLNVLWTQRFSVDGRVQFPVHLSGVIGLDGPLCQFCELSLSAVFRERSVHGSPSLVSFVSDLTKSLLCLFLEVLLVALFSIGVQLFFFVSFPCSASQPMLPQFRLL